MRVWQRGSVKLSVILASVLGLGFAASAYLNFYQHQQANQEQTQLQGQITDLTYQVKQDHIELAGTSTASPSPAPSAAVPTPSPPPSTSPTVAATASVAIAQFGVHFTASDPIVDLTYAPMQSGGLIVAGLTAQSLLAKYPHCTAASAALGMLVRRPQGQPAKSQDKFIKNLGGYSFYYVAPFNDCTPAAHSTISTDTAAITAIALPTLSQ